MVLFCLVLLSFFVWLIVLLVLLFGVCSLVDVVIIMIFFVSVDVM